MPKVSVIMPVYNGEKFLAEAIESVLNQTYSDLELIVVNDGSTDRSQEIIDSFSDPRLRKIRQANQGQASARNRGLKVSKGKFIAFLDQDDLFLLHCISERLKFFQNSTFDFVYNDFVVIDDKGDIISQSGLQWRNTSPLQSKCFKELFLKGTFIVPSSVMLRRDLFNKIGFFDEKLWGTDDYDLWLRVSYSYAFGFIPSSLIKYRIHDQNFSGNTLEMEKRTARVLLKAVNTFANIEELIGTKEMRNRLYSQCFDVAYNYLRQGDLKSARYWLKKAWQWGRKPKTLVQLIATWCGPLMRRYQAQKEV